MSSQAKVLISLASTIAAIALSAVIAGDWSRFADTAFGATAGVLLYFALWSGK